VYEFLDGKIAGRTAARLVVDVGGVGYDLAVPLTSSFPHEGRVRVFTHLVVREDSHTLYGFPDLETREVFRLLLSVRGVGPVMALAILSGMPREDLLAAIVEGNQKALQRIKGVGAKTAAQIVLDLAEKAQTLHKSLASGAARATIVPVSAGSKNVEDAVAALISIGYSDKEARKQVERAAKTVDAKDLEALVRASLAGT